MTYDGEIIDGKGECTGCGGWYKLKADGELRAHNCNGIIAVPDGGTDTAAATRTRSRSSGRSVKKTKEIPDPVVKLTIALVGTLTESTSRVIVSRATGIDRHDLPDQVVELPEPEAMIRPFAALAWPQVPGKAQRVIRDIADHSDVVDAALLWHEWLMTMREFVKQARDYRAQQEGNGSVVPIQASTQGYPGSVAASGLTPFQPASESSS